MFLFPYSQWGITAHDIIRSRKEPIGYTLMKLGQMVLKGVN